MSQPTQTTQFGRPQQPGLSTKRYVKMSSAVSEENLDSASSTDSGSCGSVASAGHGYAGIRHRNCSLTMHPLGFLLTDLLHRETHGLLELPAKLKDSRFELCAQKDEVLEAQLEKVLSKWVEDNMKEEDNSTVSERNFPPTDPSAGKQEEESKSDEEEPKQPGIMWSKEDDLTRLLVEAMTQVWTGDGSWSVTHQELLPWDGSHCRTNILVQDTSTIQNDGTATFPMAAPSTRKASAATDRRGNDQKDSTTAAKNANAALLVEVGLASEDWWKKVDQCFMYAETLMERDQLQKPMLLTVFIVDAQKPQDSTKNDVKGGRLGVFLVVPARDPSGQKDFRVALLWRCQWLELKDLAKPLVRILRATEFVMKWNHGKCKKLDYEYLGRHCCRIDQEVRNSPSASVHFDGEH
jgi:hypothetical protein